MMFSATIARFLEVQSQTQIRRSCVISTHLLRHDGELGRGPRAGHVTNLGQILSYMKGNNSCRIT